MFVINEAVCSNSGVPVRNCNCGGHRGNADDPLATNDMDELDEMALAQQFEYDDSDNVLPVFTVNFNEMASPSLRREPPTSQHVANSGDESDNVLPVFNQRPLTKFQQACLEREAAVTKAVAKRWAT